MWVYITLLLLFIFLCGRYKIGNNIEKYITNNRFSFPFYYIIIVLFVICRFDVGYDYKTYYTMLYPEPNVRQIARLELIPQCIYIISNYMKSPFFLFAAFTIPTYILVFITIHRYSKNEFESIIVFITIFFLESMCYLRQWLAISIIFYSFKYVKEKRLLKYTILCVVAFFVHRSSIIAFPIYFVYNYVPYIFSILGTVFLILLKNKILNIFLGIGSYGHYLKRIIDNELSGSKYMRYLYVILFLYMLVLGTFNKRIKNGNAQKMLSVFVLTLSVPFFLGMMGSRICLYYYVYILLLYPCILDGYKTTDRVMLLIPFYLIYLILLILSLKNPVKSLYIPYQLYFFADRTIFR